MVCRWEESVEQAPCPVFRLFFGVGGVSLGGKSVEQAPWPVFRLFFGVGSVSLGGKSVEQVAWPVFGLFFEHPPNIFTSWTRNSSFTVVISLLIGKFWITFVAGTTILFCLLFHTGSETT